MATFSYTFSTGEDVKFKLTSEKTVELEEKLGDSIPVKLAELEKMTVATEFVTAALIDGDYKSRKSTAYAIYDDMIENGKNYRDYMYLIYEILTKAGFIPSGTVEKQREQYQAQEKLEETIHKAQMKLMNEKTTSIKDSLADTKQSQK